MLPEVPSGTGRRKGKSLENAERRAALFRTRTGDPLSMKEVLFGYQLRQRE
jgi:hypothetical protein